MVGLISDALGISLVIRKREHGIICGLNPGSAHQFVLIDMFRI